ncbi:MAG: hypothetical protein H8E12_17070 [Rhodobacteraceae bacterium]|nr:hypothetical protein [Paracoccaceae bacterium]
MKDIDIRWVKNAKTKDSSFDLVVRQAYNDYPHNTATVELIGVRQKFPEAKITFVFPIKSETHNVWDYQSQKAKATSINWSVTVQANMVYNEINKDYDIYINFPSGKYNSPLLNFQEFDVFYHAVNQIKSDLNNLLTANNFS